MYVYYDNSYFFTDDFAENAFHSKELANSFKVGGNDINSSLILPMTFPHTCKIYLVNNDENLTMYLLEYDKSSVPYYVIWYDINLKNCKILCQTLNFFIFFVLMTVE